MPKLDAPWAELATRYGRALTAEWQWVVGAAVLFLAVGLAVHVRRPRALPWWVTGLAFASVILGALALAWRLRWLSDDAFISFRYAKNLVEGHGLVFNAGERVEGYTNFLWTLLIAGALSLGVDAPVASVAMSLTALVGLVIVATRLVRAHAPPDSPAVVPLAAIALGANHIVGSYATSGLETMLAAALVLFALERAISRSPLAAGLLGILATMAHPDHAIFYAVLGAVLALDRERRSGLLRYALPFLVLYLPYFAWRFSYYADFFPNTYTAKSAGIAYFEQGYLYVVTSALAAGVFGALPLVLAGATILRKTVLARFAVLAAIVFVVYVAKIGGDFMLGRLLVPILAPVLVLAELGGRWIAASRRHWIALLAVPGLLGMSLAAVPTKIIRAREEFKFMVDERTHYPLKSLRPLVIESVHQDIARDLDQYVIRHGSRPRVMVSSVGIIAYESPLPMVDSYGLTNRAIARQKLARRRRPGHEKIAHPGFTITHGVDFSEQRVYPEDYRTLSTLTVDRLAYYLPRYRRSLLDPLLRERKVRFVPFPKHLDAYAPGSAPEDRARLECDLWFFEQFYFAHEEDEARRKSITAKVVAAVPTFAGLDALLFADPTDQDWEEVRAWTFDTEAGWTVSGYAFAPFPARTEADAQATIVGTSGGFASSFAARGNDHPSGSLVSDSFEIVGDVITMRIGGGKNLEHERVSLLVGGERVMNATACESEILGRRVWNLSALVGKRAAIEVVDDASGGWGHIVVDSIREWRRRAAPSDR